MPTQPKAANRRQNRGTNPSFAVLPRDLSSKRAPKWPFSSPEPAEKKLWADLWSRPIAAVWHSQQIPPAVVARYVHLAVLDAASISPRNGAALAALENALGLTPAAMARLHLRVDDSPELTVVDDPYAEEKKARGYAS
jgi:hypothetical protein